MTVEQLKNMSQEDVLNYIRERLSPGGLITYEEPGNINSRKKHLRFEMSGYESKTGECTLHNLAVLNTFADLGIYDYTFYLFLDFYKGSGTLYYRYWDDHKDREEYLGGDGTTDIIHTIFKLTIFSGRMQRRRE